jgi:transglutaminase-like putative cysteine protease
VFLSWNITNIVSAFQKDTVQNKQVVGALAEIQSQISKITAPLQGTAYIQTEFYGDTVNLGTGSDLTDEIIFEINVNQRQPSGVRYYWKGKSYDTFTNNQWESTFNASKDYVSNEPLDQNLEVSTYTKRTFTIKTLKNLGILYSLSYPQSVNRPIKANYQLLPNDQIDIVSLELEKVTFSGEIYEIVNNIPNPTIAQLRKTTQEYPDWVKEKYLNLPDNFSEEIASLAEELTKDHSNPYDKTSEITNYLRDTITYQEQIPDPPSDQDVIEWFLFDYKQGFCNYYATAEVLMLRSIGIPARISFGYSEGDSQNTIGTEFIVRRENLHAWPEVYFQGIGWVIFEPTTIQPTINRLLGESFNESNINPIIGGFPGDDMPIMDGGETVPEGNEVPELVVEPVEIEVEDVEESTSQNITIYILLSTIALIIVFILMRKTSKISIDSAPVILESYFTKRGWKTPQWLRLWASYSKLSAEEKAFSRIIWSLYLFQKKYVFSLTPSEIVEKYNEIFPEMREISSSTLLEYQQAVYSNHSIDIKLIQENARKILRFTLIQKFLSFFRRKRHYQKI